MWFKNLQLYRLTSPFEHTAEDLTEKLEAFSFQPCGKRDESRMGWVAPLGPGYDLLCHSANGYLMVCARKEEKVLPAAVVKELVNDRVEAIELQEDRKVYRKERETIKEEVLYDALPKAFTRSFRTYAYIDPKGGWVVVDASSPKKAEELCSLLRESLGSLPAIPPQVSYSPTGVMTQWLRGMELPDDLVLGDECELREPGDEGSIIRCKRQDLSADEVTSHLDAGKLGYKLSVEWDENFTALIADDLSVKRLKFSDELISEAEDAGSEDRAAQFDANFSLMTLTLSRFLPSFLAYFGGEKAAPV